MTYCKWILGFLLLSSGVVAPAGEIQIAATGKAESPADYVTIGVTVNGQCFESSAKAAKNVTGLSNKIEEKLKAQQTPADKSLGDASTRTSLGFQRRDEYFFDGEKQVRLCRSGWYTGVRLSAKFALNQGGLGRLPTIQDEILELVDANAKRGSKGEPQVWADFSGPTPEVTPDKREKMADEALIDAIRRAKRQVRVIQKEFPGMRDPILAEVKPQPHANDGPMHEARMYTMKAADSGNGEPRASFEFGAMTEEISRIFVFRYPGPTKAELSQAAQPTVKAE